jgi:tRNA pseudouridine38-40 synthase
MRNVKISLEYDGTDFHGWQIQPGRRTIQGLLTDILSRLDHRPVTVHGASRTDAGVHACGQVASFFFHREMTERDLLRALNANLPPDVRVRELAFVSPNFHARYHALRKTYRYRIYCGSVVSPFLYRYVYPLIFPVEVEPMEQAARVLLGEHDFSAFSTRERRGKSPIRRVLSVRLWRQGDMLTFEITANGFLRYMVRTIMGTLCEIGRGRRSVDEMARILEGRDRRRAGPTLPARGLTLMKVDYGNTGMPPTAEV